MLTLTLTTLEARDRFTLPDAFVSAPYSYAFSSTQTGVVWSVNGAPPPGFRLPAGTRVGAVAIQVANLERSLAPARAGSILAGVLGLVALALANIGLFGVFAYLVQQRTHELGIRMALGAHWSQVIRVALGDSTRAIAIGLLAGFALAAGASRLLRQYLYGLTPLDPIAYAAVILTLIVAGLAATFVPARRVAKIDPMRALHYE